MGWESIAAATAALAMATLGVLAGIIAREAFRVRAWVAREQALYRQKIAEAVSERDALRRAAREAIYQLEALRKCQGWTDDSDGIDAGAWAGPRVHAAEDALRQALAGRQQFAPRADSQGWLAHASRGS